MPGLLKKLAYAVVSLLVLLGVGEGVARLAGAGGMIPYPTEGNCHQRSELLGEELRPQCTARAAGKVFHTNALGLRDDEVQDDGRARILAIGDSSTFGWGVEQHEPYPQVLQRLLDQGTPWARYRVINAGVPGYTSYHGRLYLQDRGLALGPRVVIAAYGLNDIVPGGDAITALDWQRRMTPLLRLDDALLDSSRLWRWLRVEIRRPQSTTLPPRSTPEQYGDNLRAIVTLARGASAQPVLLRFLQARSAQHAHVEALEAVARDLGVPLVVYDGPRLDAVHPTREGHRALAVQLRGRLLESGAIAP